MKKKELMITLITLTSIILIVVGVTYAFFNYVKEGTTDNSISTGTITFLYTEIDQVGRGIQLADAFPISDSVGQQQMGEKEVFNFKITSNTTPKTNIPYEITARKNENSTLDESEVKLYLTEVTGNIEKEVLLNNYDKLPQTNKVSSSKYTEKTIYEGEVPENSVDYEQDFRLRMWIDENTDFSQKEDGTYPNNEKTFIITVNVYANGKVITEEESQNKKTITIFNKEFDVIPGEPSLEEISDSTDEAYLEQVAASGIYESTSTNDNRPTYYFRGQVENNYVQFAGYLWRVVRVNEDGTIRIVMDRGIKNNEQMSYRNRYFTTSAPTKYYTNSTAIIDLENWYDTEIASNIKNKSVIASGNYFCEQAKVTQSSASSYIPDFKCAVDANGKGIVNANIGLLTYDEYVYATINTKMSNFKNYLNNIPYTTFWTMSPADDGAVWQGNIFYWGWVGNSIITNNATIRPVVNLKADTNATGEGTSESPWVVITDNVEPEVIPEQSKLLKDKIMENALIENSFIVIDPTLTFPSNYAGDFRGLYKSTATNDNRPTYFFRGDVYNNYVNFAGFTWKIIRINEDGTIRMILAEGINDNQRYQFSLSTDYFNPEIMYYSNSNVKTEVEKWYQANISDQGYENHVASGNYFCEQFKVTDVNTNSYIPDFKCSNDKNGKGIVNASVGLINYDETLFAGGYYYKSNTEFYLYDYHNGATWMMSPNDREGYYHIPKGWSLTENGTIDISQISESIPFPIRPVINLLADTMVKGNGTSTNPYVVQ